jgi:hypothetical protein
MKESNQVIFRMHLIDDYNVLLTLRNELHKKHAKAEPGFYKVCRGCNIKARVL